VGICKLGLVLVFSWRSLGAKSARIPGLVNREIISYVIRGLMHPHVVRKNERQTKG